MTPSDLLSRFPIRQVEVGEGDRVAWREAGPAATVTHVLLHGIGSASDSWAFQLQAAAGHPERRAVAWDAPGYGQSTPLSSQAPDAGEYAARLWAWLDSLGAIRPITLVGHSLGALISTRAVLLNPARVARLVLLAPARGYGTAPPAERHRKLSDRLGLLDRLGPAGMARERSAAMLSPAAPAELVAAVRATMAAIHVDGYTQAARLLDQGDLLADLAQIRCPVAVASGSADTITPPHACRSVAAQTQQDWLDLGAVGHACPLEAAISVNALTGLVDESALGPIGRTPSKN